MNTAVATTHIDHESQLHERPPQQMERTKPIVVRRVGLVDRVALHVGVALIAWGRRPLVVETRERRASHVERHVAALTRERAAERMQRLTAPRL